MRVMVELNETKRLSPEESKASSAWLAVVTIALLVVASFAGAL